MELLWSVVTITHEDRVQTDSLALTPLLGPSFACSFTRISPLLQKRRVSSLCTIIPSSLQAQKRVFGLEILNGKQGGQERSKGAGAHALSPAESVKLRM